MGQRRCRRCKYDTLHFNFPLTSPTVSAETIQKNIELMGRQIKNLEKDIEKFPPPQSDKDLFVEKMSISSYYQIVNRKNPYVQVRSFFSLNTFFTVL